MSAGIASSARRILWRLHGIIAPANGTRTTALAWPGNAIAPTRRFRCYSGSSVNNTSANATSSYGSADEPWHLPHPSASSVPLDRLKHPSRGGQNLTNRYSRLERALRGKEEYQREIEDFRDEEASWAASGDPGAKARASGESLGAGGSNTSEEEVNVVKRKRKRPFVFMGHTIPEAPEPPGPDGEPSRQSSGNYDSYVLRPFALYFVSVPIECCMSGCAICVHDLYVEALDAHEHTLNSIRSALREKGVSEGIWPKRLLSNSKESAGNREASEGLGEKRDLAGQDLVKARQASLSAFEQMELQLAARKGAQEQRPKRNDLQQRQGMGM